ncbi:unnamed protein product [Candidula unifasciata]|uniref:Uncharacterized protein n=1 Tax=Candidula unifasciata TaxID=100452 RepID=A0A8S4A083_9EUPU|nr:unnamed protein product [Candidula unifasciata]
MFVSHARVRIVGLGVKSKKRGPHRRRLAVEEVVRMPCLLPTTVTVVLGLMAVAGGAGMSVIGYVPSYMTHNLTRLLQANGSLPESHSGYDTRFLTLKICSYIGPVIMAIGMFAMIVACVFYCEIMDTYAILVPDKRSAVYDKDELYEVIVGEMKKSYAQTLVTAYSKIADRNLVTDNQSSSADGLPEQIFPVKPDSLTLEQQIDLECEGYTPSPPIPNKSYSVIQARIQRLRSEDNWLKTSSLPNIRRSVSFRRAGRVGTKITDSRTLSYDYTMDEARLRRKSMMLRSIVHWNSGSSELLTQRQRRYSSVKALPSDHRRSLDDISRQPGYGSFPLTRLIQRRGTFACGDMRTRRMKFLLLLEASESLEGVNDHKPAEGRPKVTGIRRNSFIPYTTCDKFIAGEERKTSRDRRRSSVNPFSFGNRFGNTIPQPGTRRHSFYPIRRDDKIYVGNPNEQRRHSFNPIGVNNTLKPEYVGKGEGRRGSFNPDGHYERAGEMRSLQVPPQSSRFLQVPGLDPYMEGRPSVSLEGQPVDSGHSPSACGLNYLPSSTPSCHSDRRVERRHSFNPSARMISSSVSKGGETTRLKVPKITVSEDLSPTGRFLVVPSQDSYGEQKERRHSFNTAQNIKPAPSNTLPRKPGDKLASHRLSFKQRHEAGAAPVTQTKSFLHALKPASEPASLACYAQEMVVIEPYSESRSASPCSNVSCCGSEKIWSEPSATTSRTQSISSDKSAKTVLSTSPVSVIAAERMLSYGTFQTPSSPKDGSSDDKMTHPKSNIRHVPLLSPVSLDLDLSFESVGSSAGSRFLPKSSSARSSRGKRKPQEEVFTDSLTSISSGPATLYPSVVTDANAAIHRSKSASALPAVGVEVKRSHTIQTTLYANIPVCSPSESARIQPETPPGLKS